MITGDASALRSGCAAPGQGPDRASGPDHRGELVRGMGAPGVRRWRVEVGRLPGALRRDACPRLLGPTALQSGSYNKLVVGAALQGGRPEHLAKRGMHHVSAGVRLAGAQPPLAIDGRQDTHPSHQLAAGRSGPGARSGP